MFAWDLVLEDFREAKKAYTWAGSLATLRGLSKTTPGHLVDCSLNNCRSGSFNEVSILLIEYRQTTRCQNLCWDTGYQCRDSNFSTVVVPPSPDRPR